MKKMWKKYSKNKMSVLGFVIIVLLLILVIFADLYIGYDKVLAQDVKNKLQSPSLSHICGTDNLGRDLFARLIYGARVSLGIGVAATFAGMMIGCILGAACAYIGGIFESQRGVDRKYHFKIYYTECSWSFDYKWCILFGRYTACIFWSELFGNRGTTTNSRMGIHTIFRSGIYEQWASYCNFIGTFYCSNDSRDYFDWRWSERCI